MIFRSATTVVVSATSPWEIQFFSDPTGHHMERERNRGGVMTSKQARKEGWRDRRKEGKRNICNTYFTSSHIGLHFFVS